MESQTRLSICMFSSLYPPIYTGSSIQCSILAEELVKTGCQVAVITPAITKDSPSHEIVKGVHVYRIPAIQLPRLPIALNFPWLTVSNLPSNLKRIQEILGHHQPDILHLHNHMFDMSFIAIRSAKSLHIPLVITVHTIIYHPQRVFNFILHTVDKLLLSRIILSADRIICPDQNIVDYVRNTFVTTKTTLIPYGIEILPNADPLKVNALKELYQITDGQVILSIGHVHETRNRKELIEILPRLRKKFPMIKLLIIGDVGTQKPRTLAKNLGVHENLVFTGAVPHDTLSNYLALSDLEAHWFFRKHPHKAPGIAAQEAMGAGKVVITAADQNVYGRGVLKNGFNIVLVDLNNPALLVKKIINLLEHRRLRKSIGKQAQKTIREHFSWDKISKNTLQIYHEQIILKDHEIVASSIQD